MYYDSPRIYSNSWEWSLSMMVFWGLFLLIITIYVIRLVKGQSTGTTNSQAPLDIAKERYAKGEINKEQFEQLKKDLQ